MKKIKYPEPKELLISYIACGGFIENTDAYRVGWNDCIYNMKIMNKDYIEKNNDPLTNRKE